MLPNIMLVCCETFKLVTVAQDIEQTWPTDQVVVVRWAGMSRVHALGCHLSYHREDSGLPLGAPPGAFPPLGSEK
jgi:hypothetical protein